MRSQMAPKCCVTSRVGAHCIPGTPHRTKNGIRSLLLQTQPAINPKQKPNKNDGIKTVNVAMGAQIQSLISNGFFSKI